jgi:hypothetical protein
MLSKREDHLKGPVRLVRSKRSRLSESGLARQEVEVWSRTALYDRAGNVIESSYYDSRGLLQSTISYEYDVAGREIESTAFDGDGSVVRRTVSIYDDCGRPRKECVYLADGSSVVQRSATVARDGKRIVEAHVQIDASPPARVVNDGEACVCVKKDGDRSYRAVEVFDADDKPLEVIVYNQDGSLRDKFVYAYSTAGRRIREARYAPREASASGFDDVPLVETVYTYNAAGSISEILHLRGGSPQTRTLYNYDADGNKIEEIQYEAGPLVHHVVTYYREFDRPDNWTTETKTTLYPQHGSRTLVVVTRRHIEYY